MDLWKGEGRVKKALLRVFRPDLLFFAVSAAGALAGVLLALIAPGDVTAATFAGGFAHGLPGTFSPKDVALAVLFQALPMVLIYYSAFGILVRGTAAAVLLLRALLGGYCVTTAFWIGDFEDPIFAVLWFLFLLFELLTLSFHASFAHLAESFSKTILRKRSKYAVKKFTGDFLFFYGLILFFYIARGLIVALMNL